MGKGSDKAAARAYQASAQATAGAAAEANRLAYELGQQELAFSRKQFDYYKPILEGITNSQLDMMRQTQQQGQDYYDYQMQTFRPLEQQMVADAQKFNSDAYREELARKAAADAGLAFSTTQKASERAMMSMGVNPNSGRFAGMQNQNALGLAAARANAMTGARQQADTVGYARQMDAVGLGRNLPGASTGAYSLALNAGNSAGGNAMSAGNNYLAGMNQGIGTIQGGQQMQLQGLSNVMNSRANMYGSVMNSNAGNMQGIGSLVGLLGNAAIGKWV